MNNSAQKPGAPENPSANTSASPSPAKSRALVRDEHAGQPESAASRETFPQRTRKPGSAGLANEARPGLGTRGSESEDAAARAAQPLDSSEQGSEPHVTTRSYEEPRPEPREQSPDSFAHEEERSTGVSGHSGNS
jgi:hypothetical protein